MYEFKFGWLAKYWPFYIEGLKNTLALAVITVFLGAVVGTVLAMMKLSKSRIVRFFASLYIEFIRGTPLMVQVLMLHYGVFGMLFKINLPIFTSSIIVLSINSSAYVAEIIRSGIQAVPKGQMEAARSLGMRYSAAMLRIIMPQAIKNILPALGNEFVTVIKESSIMSIIGMGDLMYKANTISGNTYLYFEPLLIVSLIYFVLTFSLSKLLGYIESRMGDSAAGRMEKADRSIMGKRLFGMGVKRENR